MKAKILTFLLLFFLSATLSCKALQKTSGEEEPLKQLMADDWDTRTRGLFALMDLAGGGHKLSAEAKRDILNALDKISQEAKGFISRLKTEGKSQVQIADAFTREFPPDTYGDFTKALVIFIASRRIEGSLPHVFEFLTEANYSAPPVVLTLYGGEARDLLVGKVLKGTIMERKIAISALSGWVNPIESDDFDMNMMPRLGESELQAVKPVLLKAAEDSDDDIRSLALSCIEAFIAEPDVRQLISKMAMSDGDKYIRKDAQQILNRHQ